MSYVHGALCGILIFFAVLQYNDPDGYYWGPVYLLAAAWSFLAAYRPEWFRSSPVVRFGAPLSVALFLAGFVSLASTIDRNWIHIEEAREAFGYVICAVSTALAFWDSRRRTAGVGDRAEANRA